MSTAWHYRPSAKEEVAPYWHWPPRPGAIGKWLFENFLQLSDRLIFVVFACAVAYWWAPFSEQQAILQPSWIATAFVRNFVALLVVAGGLHVWFYGIDGQGRRLKFDPRPYSKKRSARFRFGYQTWDNVFHSLCSGVPIATAFEVLLRWSSAQGLLPAPAFADSWLYFVLLFPALTVLHSMHFYVIHRSLHWPPLYRLAHHVHHRNVNTGPWSGFSMHPVEHLMYLSFMVLFFIIPAHPVHILFALYWLVLGAASSHSGYQAVFVGNKPRLLLGTFMHQLHHRHFECSYGNTEMPWDMWLGTFHDGSEDGTKATRERFRRKRAPAQ